TDVDDLEAVTAAVAGDPGVAFASPPVLNDEADPTAALWQVVPTTGPQDAATNELVERLRDDVLPPVEGEAGIDVSITGMVATNNDFSDYLESRMVWFFTAVLALSFVLLMVLFRSVLVTLKTVGMDVLACGLPCGL